MATNDGATGARVPGPGHGALPDPRILYIHPHNHLADRVVPIGAVGAANLLPRPPVGRFAFEVTAADVEAASVVLLGVHWFFPIGVLDEMIAAIRRLNPSARIVAGGLTVGFYRDHFATRFPVDYVCTDDVELSFPTLIAHLLAGDTPPPLTNVIPRGGSAPSSTRRLAQDEFDRIDWLRIDWFPAYRRWVVEQHERYDGEEVRDGIYPTLPLTRGCVRTCDFCFGAYQRRVFGPRVLLRSPAQLVHDLRAIAADPALRFVTLMFAEACYLRYFAAALDGLRIPLDAYLMFCGAPDPGVLDRLRSGFAGGVSLLAIPPDELAPLTRDHAGAARDAEYARLIEHFRRMANTRTLIYYVGHRPSAGQLATADDRVSFVSGEDWSIARPSLDDLGPEQDFAGQLDHLVGVARQTAALHLLRALVPAVRKTLNPELDTATFLSPELTRDCDAVEARIHRMLLDQVRAERAVGYSALRLRWFATRALAGLPAAWVPPGAPFDGPCAWQPTLNGFAWQGRVVVARGDGKCLWIAPVPLVCAGAQELGLEDWVRTQVPAVPVTTETEREVALGGETRGDELLLWLEDGPTRREWKLCAPAVAPVFSTADWLRPGMALALLGVLLSRPVLRRRGWSIESFAFSQSQLSLAIASTTRRAGLALFPRMAGQRCPGTAEIGCQLFGPGGGDLARDADVEELQEAVVRLVASIERVVGAPPNVANLG